MTYEAMRYEIDEDYDNEYESIEDMLYPCPLCNGQLEVHEDNFVQCKECGESIGWYIPTAGAVKLLTEIVEHINSKERK